MSATTFVCLMILFVGLATFGAGFLYGVVWANDQRRDYDRRTLQGLKRMGRVR